MQRKQRAHRRAMRHRDTTGAWVGLILAALVAVLLLGLTVTAQLQLIPYSSTDHCAMLYGVNNCK